MKRFRKRLICAAVLSGSMIGLPFAGSVQLHAAPTAGSAAADQHDIVDTATAAGQFNTLLAAAKAAGLVETLRSEGPLTVFAPTDAAFAKLPAGTVESLLKPENKEKLASILKYHVVAGNYPAAKVVDATELKSVLGQYLPIQAGESGVMIDTAKVVKTDIHASNGVIHVIDSVILPRPDVVDTAAQAGSFSTLLAAAKAAGLVEALKAQGPITVFAPTDAAFAKLPAGTVESLLKPENIDQLRAILTYHVVPGRMTAAKVVKADSLKTLEGRTLKVRISEGKVSINDAGVTGADVLAGNGVIHVIDSVLLPPAEQVGLAPATQR